MIVPCMVNRWFQQILEDDHGIPDGGISISKPPRDRDADELETWGKNTIELTSWRYLSLFGTSIWGFSKAGWFISWEIPV